ncbi:hypothetical protein K3495_g16251, partial [Podosphaera aphanis]
MLKNDKKKVPADFKMWVDNIKDKLMTTHSDSLSSSHVSRASFATGIDLNHVHDQSLSKPPKNKGISNVNLKRQYEDSSEGQGKRRKKKPDCPCGRGCTTPWSKCYYLTPSAAPSNFEPNPEIVNHIKNLREARPGLDKALKYHEDKIRKQGKSSSGTAFFASTFAVNTMTDDEELLARSYIADTGANSHVINTPHRYQILRKALP